MDRFVYAKIKLGGEEGKEEYIRAKIKWNGHHFNAQSFVDLVADESMAEGECGPREIIRIRVVCQGLLRDMDAARQGELEMRLRTKGDIRDGEEAFTPRREYLWPPENTPDELKELLCPGGRAGDVEAVLGDEGIIYMVGEPTRDTGERALVFISFDPTFGFKGMKRLDGGFAYPKMMRKKDVDWIREKKRKSVSGLDPNPEILKYDQAESILGLAKRLKDEGVTNSMFNSSARDEAPTLKVNSTVLTPSPPPYAWLQPAKPLPSLPPLSQCTTPSSPSTPKMSNERPSFEKLST